MMRSISRAAVVGCIALAALGAAAVLDVGSRAAEAAPSASPFEGTYVGGDPRGYVSQWTVTISDAGRITGARSGSGRDKISGQVGADGSCSLSVSATIWVFDNHGHSAGEAMEFRLRTVNYKSSGNIAPDASGNLVGTDDRGGGFIWVRQ